MDREPPHSSNVRPGGKGKRRAGTQSGCFFFLSFAKASIGHGGREERGCRTQKRQLRADANLVP